MTSNRICITDDCLNLRVYAQHCNRCYLAEKRRIKQDGRGRPRKPLNPAVPKHTEGAMFCSPCNSYYMLEHMSGTKKKKLCKNCTRRYSYNVRTTEKNRETHLLRRYGLNQEELEALMDSVNHQCQICSKPIGGSGTTAIDHCHVTKHVRGILCVECNSGLGYFHDNVSWMLNAVNYLTATGRASHEQMSFI
jgi:hypothetical protein